MKQTIKYLEFVKKNWVIIALVLIIIWGFGLRIYQLDEQSYWIDEGFTLNAVLETLEKGYPVLDSGVSYSRELLNTYLISGSVALFGFNPWAARIISVLFGTGFILLMYFFVKELFKSQKLALITSFLISISYWEVAWSRQARMYILLQFFFFASLYLFWLLLDKYSHKRLALLFLSTIAACLCHKFGLLLLIIYLFIGLLRFVNPLEKKKILEARRSMTMKFIQKYKWLIFIGLIFVIPIVGIEFYKVFLTSYFENGSGISDNFTTFLYLRGLVQFCFIPIGFTLLGLFWYIYKEKGIFSVFFLFSSYVIPFIIIIRTTNLFHLRYLVFIYPILLVFSSYFVYQILKVASRKKYLFVIIIILLLIGVGSISDFVYMPQITYALEYRTPQPNFSEAYRAIYDSGWNSKTDLIVSGFTPINRIYLDDAGIWLAILYSGNGSLNEKIIDENEIYNNTEVIHSAEELVNTTANQNTYLVVDFMTRVRVEKNFISIIMANGFNEIYFDRTSQVINNISVYYRDGK
jgi:4-amino-4-deoxy-L-arabinose transferase-like glycosyltransferase